MTARQARMEMFRRTQELVQAKNAAARKDAFTRRPSPEPQKFAEVEAREIDS